MCEQSFALLPCFRAHEIVFRGLGYKCTFGISPVDLVYTPLGHLHSITCPVQWENSPEQGIYPSYYPSFLSVKNAVSSGRNGFCQRVLT